ncbi:MAG TPA: adenylate/guanylate cyclase domain-containing protein, partial [Candidatus Dormibacteraeota bacterium]|nr:adenylate/guanylate cyclase domain-containing protein [Candidatus Dormibacteraeota bacterium]
MKTPNDTSDGLETPFSSEALPTQPETMPSSKTTKPGKSPPSRLPIGTVTFMLTDVEGSTRRWEADPKAAKKSMAALGRIIGDTVDKHGGARPLEQGEGDSAVAAFARASDAVDAAVAVQLALQRGSPTLANLRVRIGLHSGEAELRGGGNYTGIALNRCARIRSAAHGGQVVVSAATYDLVLDHLSDGVTLKDLGPHRLKDLSRPEHIYQVCNRDLANDFPPLRSLDSFPNNLPLQMTSFIGREEEMAEVRQMLHDSRLVTLTGSGGSGKTRLSIQLAADLLDQYADGSWLVDLSPITDPALIPNAAAAAMSIREVEGQELTRTITNRLAGSNTLLILDNCEHLLDASAAFASMVLKACPEVGILATSREPIGVAGEAQWRVRSLACPTQSGDQSIEALGQFEAVRLFIDRALKVRPNFQVSNETAPHVAEICQRLDGIPLAIELAAARARVLTPQQILQGLDDRFRLLTGGSRASMPRQQTLQASVQWSYQLLTATEQSLLRRLSVFQGGFTLSAAERVGSDDSPSESGDRESIEEYTILDLLSQLVDKSLVAFDDEGAAGRYRLLETIRQYGAERLADAGESPVRRRRHLDHFILLAEEAEIALKGHEMLRWLGVVDLEQDNIRAALDWSRSEDDADGGLRLATAMWVYWIAGGHLSEAAARLDEVIDMDGGEPRLTARAVAAKAFVALFGTDVAGTRWIAEEAITLAHPLGDTYTVAWAKAAAAWGYVIAEPEVAEARCAEAVAIARQVDDHWILANALAAYGLFHAAGQEPTRAIPLLEEGLSLAREHGDQMNMCESLMWLGLTRFILGEFGLAETLAKEAVINARIIGIPLYLGQAQTVLGGSMTMRGAYAEAETVLDQAVGLGRELGNILILAMALVWRLRLAVASGAELDEADADEAVRLPEVMEQHALVSVARISRGVAAFERGLLETARTEFEEALSYARRCKNNWLVSQSLNGLARLALAEGELEAAEAHAYESLASATDGSVPTGIADGLALLGGLANERQEWLRAARLLGASETVRTGVGYVRFLPDQRTYEADSAAAREKLGEAEFQRAYEEGTAMSTDYALTYAAKGRGSRHRPATGWASLTPV